MPPPPDEIFVIIVTYQSAECISACLTSLQHTDSVRRVSIVVIDNASSDGSAAMSENCARSFDARRVRCRVQRNASNLGFTRALNQGLLQRSAGAAVLFLNPDTILPPDTLPLLLQKLYAEDCVGVVAPQLRYPETPESILKNSSHPARDQEGWPAEQQTPSAEAGKAPESPGPVPLIQPSCRRFPSYWDLACECTGLTKLFPHSRLFNRWKMGDFDHRTAREVDQPQGAFLLARPEVVAQVGAWDEGFPLFFSDVDWCRRVWQAGWKIRFEPEVFAWHAQGASVNRVKAMAIWSSHLSFWRYLRKWRKSWLDEFLSLVAWPVLMGTAALRAAWHGLHRGTVDQQ